ncbi:MAG: trypsin-like peptidase domain-containing protein [Nitrospirae bacterium]|nr:trypsin-like peptidase domain-containing protein [Nitrospirota bacterium]
MGTTEARGAMKFMLCHLSGSRRGRTEYLETEHATFGSDPACTVRFDRDQDRNVCPIHAELIVENQMPTLADRSGETALWVNGARQAGAVLRDGDVVQFGEQGPLVRFRTVANGAGFAKPLRTIVADSRDIVVRTPHRRFLSPVYLMRHIVSDILRYASPALKGLTVALLLAPVAAIAVLGVATYRQHQQARLAEQRMAALVSQLESGRGTLAELGRRIEQERQTVFELRRERDELVARLTAALKPQPPARAAQPELEAIRSQLSALESAQRFAEEIVLRYGSGVGLLQGGYGFTEKTTGRPLRYEGFDQIGNPLVDKDGNTLVTVEGETPRVIIYYAGTGFLVDGRGTVVTNRHLVQMWNNFEPAQQALQAGFDPDLIVLRLFLPGSPDPYALGLVAVSERDDLAVLKTDRLPTGATPLQLAHREARPRVGEPVVVLGYPGTMDSLLGRTAKPTSDDILVKAGADPVKLADLLSQRSLIRPLVTQGHVSDVSEDLVTYEAGSATGSSGGPVIDRQGRVIAVNRGVLQRAGGVNVGLSVLRTWDVLDQAKGSATPAGRSSGGSVRDRQRGSP